MKAQPLKKRINIFMTCIILVFCLLLGRLFYMQITRGDFYESRAAYNSIRSTFIPAPRGQILGRNGKVFAYDVPRLNICAVPYEIEDINVFSKILAPYIGCKPYKIREILKSASSDPHRIVIIKSKVDTSTMMKVAEIQGDLPGLHLEVQPVREYPQKELAAHILGFVGEITEEELKPLKNQGYKAGDYIGKDGIEKQYDEYLRGTCGERKDLVDASGRVIRTISEKEPIPGKSVYLSIDLDLQAKVEDALKWHVKSLSSVSREKLAASAIIENINTGEILAIASIPEFDPNHFSRGISEKRFSELINRKDYPLLNRSIAGAYPPASTFKMITAAAALQEGICTGYSPFNCPGYYMAGGQRFNCFVRSGHGKINFNDAIGYSCDVVFYILGNELGAEKLIKYAKEFGIGQRTGIDLPGESEGLLPDNKWKLKTFKEPWFNGDTINMSIGQGFLGATPLQMAVVTAAVANGGAIYKPRLAYKITTADGSPIKDFLPEKIRSINVSPENFEFIREGMRSVVKKGTAKKLDANISAAGKTGTAESFPSPENPHGRNHTWFAGFAPAYEPEISLIVFFERSAGYAGNTTTPIATEILDAYASITGKNNKEEQ